MKRSHEEFYELMASRGLSYGPAFQIVGDLQRGVDDAVASLQVPEPVAREASAYHLHPALGDALLQLIGGAVPLEEDGSFSPFTYMPVGVRRVRMLKAIDDFTQPLFVYARRTSTDSNPSPERVEADIYLTAADGEVLVAFEGAQVQRLGRSGPAGSTTDTSRWLYEIAWREEPLKSEAGGVGGQMAASSSASDQWLIFADAKGVARKLADQLAARGKSCMLVEAAKEYVSPLNKSSNGHASRQDVAKIDPLDETHYRRLLDDAFGSAKKTCAGIVHLWSLDIAASEPSSPRESRAT